MANIELNWQQIKFLQDFFEWHFGDDVKNELSSQTSLKIAESIIIKLKEANE